MVVERIIGCGKGMIVCQRDASGGPYLVAKCNLPPQIVVGGDERECVKCIGENQ